MVNARGVLLISFFFSPSIGGTETHLTDLTKFLSDYGARVFVVTFQSLTSSEHAPILEKRGSLRIYRIPSPIHGMFYRLQLQPLVRLLLLMPVLLLCSVFVMAIHRKHIQVVHCHEINSALVASILCWIFNKRSVITVHSVQDFDTLSPLGRMTIRVMSRFDSVLAISRLVKSKILPMVSIPERIILMTYWTDLSLFSPTSKSTGKSKIGQEGKFVVLFAGRFVEAKGISLLLSASKELENFPDLKFLIVGQGPLQGKIINECHSSKNLFLVGPVDWQSMKVYYGLADVVAVPSVYEEGFGRVVMESLACGTPVIGTKRGAIPEAMDETVGILVEPTRESLVHAISEVYTNPSLLRRLTSNCRKYAESKFSINNADTVLEAYDWNK